MSHALPWSKFVWKSWLEDRLLRRCSFAAKGCWIDCLALAYDCERPGILERDGKPMTVEDIAGELDADPQEVARLLQELERHAVFSRNEQGSIFSRRMVRDEELREKGRISGRQGGSPALRNTGQTGKGRRTS